VVSSDQCLYRGARGLANLLGPPASSDVTTNHVANLYSLTKFFTACCILKLVENGELDLSTQVRDILPEWQEQLLINDCTIEELILHTAGMPNPLPLKWVRLKSDTTSHHDEESKLCKILKSNPPRSTGHNKNHYAYSNIGYWVLGKVLSQTCDKSMNNFGDICQELLFSGNLSDEHAKAIGTTFSEEEPMAMGHVAHWSILGMAAPYLVPSGMIQDQPNKNWLCMAPHYLDGASYGGLVASKRRLGNLCSSSYKARF
jgi:D-alanyl-D-alanine carboxypeptidase